MRKTATTRKPIAERERGIDEALFYAIGHPIRIAALAILNDGKVSPSEIAAIMGEDVIVVGNHIRRLFKSGCIEAAGTAAVRNVTQHFYRAVATPTLNDAGYRTMPTEVRREVCALIVQAIMVEMLASLLARKLEQDDDLRLCWQRLNVDAEGKKEVAAELKASVERLAEIKTRNASRLAKSKVTATTKVVALSAFPPSRSEQVDYAYVLPARE